MSRVTWSVDREGSSRSGAFRGWVAGGAKYGNRDGGGRCRRDTRSRLLKLSGFLGEQRQQQLRRLGETGPYKDNEVRGTYDSTRLVSSAAFQQGPVTFYVRTYVRGVPRLAPTFYAETQSVMSVTRGHSDRSLFSGSIFRPVHLFHSSISTFLVRIPRIFLGFPQSRRRIGEFPIFERSREKSGLSRYSSSAETGFTTGFWPPPTLLPFALLLRFFSRCRAPFDFAIPRKRKFLRSSLPPSFSRKTIDPNSKHDQERTFHPFARNRIFFFSIFSLLPSVFRVLERKKEIVNSGLSRKMT